MELLLFLKERVLAMDISVFRFINVKLHNELLAYLMKFTANDIFLAAVIFAGVVVFLKKTGDKGKLNAAFVLWTVITANIISTYLIKPVFKRQRPVVALDNIYFLVKMGHYGYAFPSTHTAMAAVIAAFLWDDYPGARPVLALFVFLVGFFCVYTGGHYPLDVIGGFVLGVLCGRIALMIRNYNDKRRTER
jgi:undecaprenyl-diphosphatase